MVRSTTQARAMIVIASDAGIITAARYRCACMNQPTARKHSAITVNQAAGRCLELATLRSTL